MNFDDMIAELGQVREKLYNLISECDAKAVGMDEVAEHLFEAAREVRKARIEIRKAIGR